jgi:hypothetical protein
LAPACTYPSARARPIPRIPPVTTTTRPFMSKRIPEALFVHRRSALTSLSLQRSLTGNPTPGAELSRTYRSAERVFSTRSGGSVKDALF